MFLGMARQFGRFGECDGRDPRAAFAQRHHWLEGAACLVQRDGKRFWPLGRGERAGEQKIVLGFEDAAYFLEYWLASPVMRLRTHPTSERLLPCAACEAGHLQVAGADLGVRGSCRANGDKHGWRETPQYC